MFDCDLQCRDTWCMRTSMLLVGSSQASGLGRAVELDRVLVHWSDCESIHKCGLDPSVASPLDVDGLYHAQHIMCYVLGQLRDMIDSS